MLKLLNSRKVVLYLLLVFLVVLVLSTFLPSYYTLPEKQWADLEEKKPFIYWLATHFATPFLVKGPVFLILSAFLFLSTLVCTVTRIRKWLTHHETDFTKDRAFSFSVEEHSPLGIAVLKTKTETILKKRRWGYLLMEDPGRVSIAAQKGLNLGFWGSVVFHGGLLLCFLAAPVTAFSLFRGEVILPEGTGVSLREGVISHIGDGPASLPPLAISVHDLRGIYEQGKYKVDFGGRMRVSGASTPEEHLFGVNKPISIRGYQFTLHEFGFSPRVILEKKGEPVFDYALNLRHPEKGDYFEMPGGKRLFILLLPDFQRQGSRIWTKSKDPNNPVMLVKVFEGDQEVFQKLLPLHEKFVSGPYTVGFTELRNWTNFIIVRDAGIPVLIFGLSVGIAGLFFRFLSNERRLEMELEQQGTGSLIRLSGYSRYYPAFLEKEVRHMSDLIRGEG